MKGPIFVVILCFAYSYGMSTGLKEEEKEEGLFNAGNIRGYIEQSGKGQMVIFPGLPPTTGEGAFAKILTWLNAKGFQTVNSTIIKEMALGDYYLQIGSYSVHNKYDRMSDEGTYLKFYKNVSGKLTMAVNGVVSSLTPWPVNNAQL